MARLCISNHLSVEGDRWGEERQRKWYRVSCREYSSTADCDAACAVLLSLSKSNKLVINDRGSASASVQRFITLLGGNSLSSCIVGAYRLVNRLNHGAAPHRFSARDVSWLGSRSPFLQAPL